MKHKDYLDKLNGPFGFYVIRKALYYGEQKFDFGNDNQSNVCLIMWFLVNIKKNYWKWMYIAQDATSNYEQWKTSPQGKAFKILGSYHPYGHRIGLHCTVILEFCNECDSATIIEILPKEDEISSQKTTDKKLTNKGASYETK